MNAIVVEVGSQWTKIGHAADDLPATVLQTNNTHTQTQSIHHALQEYNRRCIPSTPSLVLPLFVITDALTAIQTQKELVEECFETLSPPALFLGKAQPLSAFATENTTAFVVDCGASSTRIVPVFNGHALDSYHSIEIAGNAIDTEAAKILNSKLGSNASVQSLLEGYPPSSPWHCEAVVREYKETVLHIPVKTEEPQTNEQIGYVLPDGTEIVTGDERKKMADCLFDCEMEKAIRQTIEKTPAQLHPQLLSKIVLVGGTSLASGYEERMTEIFAKISPQCRVVEATRERKLFSSWIGGAVLSTVDEFQHLWITAKEYEECGGGCVEKRNF